MTQRAPPEYMFLIDDDDVIFSVVYVLRPQPYADKKCWHCIAKSNRHFNLHSRHHYIITTIADSIFFLAGMNVGGWIRG